jgi:hypothetical protein
LLSSISMSYDRSTTTQPNSSHHKVLPDEIHPSDDYLALPRKPNLPASSQHVPHPSSSSSSNSSPPKRVIPISPAPSTRQLDQTSLTSPPASSSTSHTLPAANIFSIPPLRDFEPSPLALSYTTKTPVTHPLPTHEPPASPPLVLTLLLSIVTSTQVWLLMPPT